MKLEYKRMFRLMSSRSQMCVGLRVLFHSFSHNFYGSSDEKGCHIKGDHIVIWIDIDCNWLATHLLNSVPHLHPTLAGIGSSNHMTQKTWKFGNWMAGWLDGQFWCVELLSHSPGFYEFGVPCFPTMGIRQLWDVCLHCTVVWVYATHSWSECAPSLRIFRSPHEHVNVSPEYCAFQIWSFCLFVFVVECIF